MGDIKWDQDGLSALIAEELALFAATGAFIEVLAGRSDQPVEDILVKVPEGRRAEMKDLFQFIQALDEAHQKEVINRIEEMLERTKCPDNM